MIGFADDVLLPPHLAAEVAAALPMAATWRFPTPGTSVSSNVPDAVNGAMLEFFAGARV